MNPEQLFKDLESRIREDITEENYSTRKRLLETEKNSFIKEVNNLIIMEYKKLVAELEKEFKKNTSFGVDRKRGYQDAILDLKIIIKDKENENIQS